MNASHVPEYKINLDALLAFACVQEYAMIDNGVSIDQAHEMLPLEKAERDGLWVWKASEIDYSSGERGMRAIHRSFDLVDTALNNGVKYKANRLNDYSSEMSSSVNKVYLIKEPTRLSESAHAYCVGDKEKIEFLLNKHITHLGKYARIDSGRIKEIIVEATDDHKAWASRVMPWQEELREDSYYVSVFETVHPPYWKKENRVMAYRKA